MSTSSTPGFPDAGRGLLQNAMYVGITLENILYGMVLLLYFKTMHILLRNRTLPRRFTLFYAIFSSVMVFLVTIWVATSAFFGEKMWLLDDRYPGGADAYFDANISDWYLDWGTTSFIILQLMTDGLMIYRCRVVWNNDHVIILPIFLWVSSLVLGIFVDWTSSSPGGNFFAGVSSQLALAYYSVSVFLNTLLTCLICYRIMRHGRTVQQNIGHQYALVYFGVIVLFVESVLPYTLAGIAFLVSLGVNSLVSLALLPLYALLMCLSPQLLILRVVGGKAWHNLPSEPPVSAIRFTPSDLVGQQTTSTAAGIHLQSLSKSYSVDEPKKAVVSEV